LGGPAPEGNSPFDRSATFPCIEVDPQPVFPVRELGLVGDDAGRPTGLEGHPGVPREVAIGGEVLDLDLRDLVGRGAEDEAHMLIAGRFRGQIGRQQGAAGEKQDGEELSPRPGRRRLRRRTSLELG